MKAYAYIRVSSVGQLSGDGPERQAAVIREYAAVHGIEIAGWYQDNVTGTIEARPQLATMLVALEENGLGIKTVLIEKMDRLARDLLVQEAIIRDLQKLKVGLISAIEGDDLLSSDPTRKLVRQMLGAIAEYEKTMIVLKLRAARERKKARLGKCEGQKGYPVELRQRIRAMAQAATFEDVAAHLNGEGLTMLSGKQWTAKAVSNVTYRGGMK